MTDGAAATRTFLFTDVEGSTSLLKSLRERYGEVLAEHQRLLRDAVAAHGGEEVDTQGDACFFAFGTAADAVRAAVDAQLALSNHDWPDGNNLHVRMGLHSGRASRENGRYHGVAVHRAARISGAAHGGQILLSQTTRELLEDEEDAGELAARDLGVHRLKDLERPAHLFQAVAPGLRRDFPSPRTGLAQERRRRRVLVAALALLAIAGASAFLLLRREAGPPPLAANTLVRIDPNTNDIEDVIPVGRRPEGVTVSGDAVWVVNKGEQTVWRLDSEGDVTARVGNLSGPGAIMPDGHGGVWVVGSRAEGEDASLFHVNRGGIRVRTYDLHDPAIWAATFGDGFVWLTSVSDLRLDGRDYLLRFDPRSGKVKKFRVGAGDVPAGIALTQNGVWMPNYRSRSLTQFDPINRRIDRFELHPSGGLTSIAGAGESIWVGDDFSPRVWKVDSFTGEQQDIVNLPGRGTGGVIVAAADADGAWAFGPARHGVYRIDADGSVVARIGTGRWAPSGLAVAPDAVWVTVGPLNE